MESTFEDILNNDELLFIAFGNLSSNKLKELSLRLQTFANHNEENERREEQRAALQAISDAIDDYIDNYGSFIFKICVPTDNNFYERYVFEAYAVEDAEKIPKGFGIEFAGKGGQIF